MSDGDVVQKKTGKETDAGSFSAKISAGRRSIPCRRRTKEHQSSRSFLKHGACPEAALTSAS